MAPRWHPEYTSSVQDSHLYAAPEPFSGLIFRPDATRMPRLLGKPLRYVAPMDFEAALRKLIADVVRDELQRAVAELRATIGAQNERRSTEDEFVDVQGAAEMVGLHQSTIREWIHSGRGTISVQSSAEEGTRFDVHLPRHATANGQS